MKQVKVPIKVVNGEVRAAQAWFWAPAWQKAERQASDDIRKGRTRTYAAESDFLRRFAK